MFGLGVWEMVVVVTVVALRFLVPVALVGLAAFFVLRHRSRQRG